MYLSGGNKEVATEYLFYSVSVCHDVAVFIPNPERYIAGIKRCGTDTAEPLEDAMKKAVI